MFIKRVAAVIFAGILIFGFSGCAVKNETTVYSEEHTGSVTVQTAEDVSLDGASDSALAAIVYCADNDEVLYGHNINDKRAIASITKIMTAVVALEYASSLDKEVKITPEMYAEGSSMYLKEGEIIRLSELVKGMMAVSGNDAANAVALTVGGSDEKFADIHYGTKEITGREMIIHNGATTERYNIIGVIKTGSGLLQNVMGSVIPDFIYIPYSTMQKNLSSQNVVERLCLLLQSFPSGLSSSSVVCVCAAKEAETYENPGRAVVRQRGAQ